MNPPPPITRIGSIGSYRRSGELGDGLVGPVVELICTFEHLGRLVELDRARFVGKWAGGHEALRTTSLVRPTTLLRGFAFARNVLIVAPREIRLFLVGRRGGDGGGARQHRLAHSELVATAQTERSRASATPTMISTAIMPALTVYAVVRPACS